MTEYGSLQEHADAYLDLLRGIGPPLTVYPAEGGGVQTVPPGAEPPYVAAHFYGERPNGGRLTMGSTRMRLRAYLHCVGATDIAARAVSDLVASALLDVRPDIPGRSVYPIRHESSREPREDESIGALFSTLTEIYRLESNPGVDGS
jgi:hypothetical protein